MSPTERIDNQFYKIESALIKLYFSWKYKLVYSYFDFPEEILKLIFEIKHFDAIELYRSKLEELFIITFGLSNSIGTMTKDCDLDFELSHTPNLYIEKLKSFNYLRFNYKKNYYNSFEGIKPSSSISRLWVGSESFNPYMKDVPEIWFQKFETYIKQNIERRTYCIKELAFIEETIGKDEYNTYKEMCLEVIKIKSLQINEEILSEPSFRQEVCHQFNKINECKDYFNSIINEVTLTFSMGKPNPIAHREKHNITSWIEYDILSPLTTKLNMFNKSLSQKQQHNKSKNTKAVALKYYCLYKTGNFSPTQGRTKDDIIKEIAGKYDFNWTTLRTHFYKAFNPKNDFLNSYNPDDLIKDISTVIKWFQEEKNFKALEFANSILQKTQIKSTKHIL